MQTFTKLLVSNFAFISREFAISHRPSPPLKIITITRFGEFTNFPIDINPAKTKNLTKPFNLGLKPRATTYRTYGASLL